MKSVEDGVIKIVDGVLSRESLLPSISRKDEDVIKFVGDYLGMRSFNLSLDTKILGDNYGMSSFKPNSEKTLVEDIRIHPIDLRELIMTIEEKFNVKIPNEEVTSIVQIRDIVNAVKRALQGS